MECNSNSSTQNILEERPRPSSVAQLSYSQHKGCDGTLTQVASDQRRKGRKSMSRRSGQRGHVVKKGSMWHVRFYVDLPGQETRQRRSVPIGPCTGKDKLTKPEAMRKGTEVIVSLGVNTPEHLERAMQINPVVTFGQRVEWCRKYHKAWTDGKPSSVLSMESQLTKHILPRFGHLPLDSVDEIAVQEFVADLKRTTFKMTKRNGDFIKTYKLSRKTILNIMGAVKLVLGRKVWMTWELDLGKPEDPQAALFHGRAVEADHRRSRRSIPRPIRIAGRNGNANWRGRRSARR